MPRLQGARLHLDLITTDPDSCEKLYARYVETHRAISAGSTRDDLEDNKPQSHEDFFYRY
jgi:hypothetical protein